MGLVVVSIASLLPITVYVKGNCDKFVNMQRVIDPCGGRKLRKTKKLFIAFVDFDKRGFKPNCSPWVFIRWLIR